MNHKNRNNNAIYIANPKINRRKAIKKTMQSFGLSAMGLNSMRGLSIGSQGNSTRKLLQIFLSGGWDSAMTTDPVIAGSDKFASSIYDLRYKSSNHREFMGHPAMVPNKPNLWVGPGLAAIVSSLNEIPLAIINGLMVEVTAHELAMNYLYSGQLSLSRSREYPASIATIAAHFGGFPAHVVLGQGIPLAETSVLTPPLHSIDTNLLSSMLAGPYSNDFFKESTINRTENFIKELNVKFEKRLALAGQASLSSWKKAEEGINQLYKNRFDKKLQLTDSLHTRFNTLNKSDSPGAKLAVGALSLKAGLTRFVTINFSGFDTHSNHFNTHVPLIQNFALSLRGLIDYLNTEIDPDDQTKKLAETTTVLILSEFVRTPTFNGASGTDHWPVASAILLGANVRDNIVIGATNAAAQVTPYQSKILIPEHLHATLLRSFGLMSEADRISGVHLEGLFT